MAIVVGIGIIVLCFLGCLVFDRFLSEASKKMKKEKRPMVNDFILFSTLGRYVFFFPPALILFLVRDIINSNKETVEREIMEIGDIIEVLDVKEKVIEAWEKEGYQFFISEQEDSQMRAIGVLCDSKKKDLSYEKIDSVIEDIFSFLEVMITTVTIKGKKHPILALDISDGTEEDVKEIRNELETVIREFNSMIEEEHPSVNMKKQVLFLAGALGSGIIAFYIWIFLMLDINSPAIQMVKGIIVAVFVGLAFLFGLSMKMPKKKKK